MQLEHRGHEVVLAGALLQPAHEVGDRHVKVLGVHHRYVQQQTADGAPDGFGLRLGHPEQHLELHAIPDAATAGERPRIGDVEEVVPGDADAHVRGMLGLQCVIQHPLVVGVGVPFCRQGRYGPVVQRGLHVFHWQVGAFDQPHLDAGATPCAARPSPVLQAHHRAQRIGQIRLQHDPGFEAEQFGPVEQLGEHRDRQLQVAVFLHVEVDELLRRRGRRLGEQRQQVGRDVVDGVVERPRRVRGHGGRDLDRHVVDVGTGEQLFSALQPAGRLGLAEHGLTEQVDVEADATIADPCDGPSEAGVGRVDQQVTDHLAQHLPGNRDDQTGRDHRYQGTELDQQPFMQRQEARGVAREGAQVGSGDLVVFGPDHAVDEADGEIQAMWIAKDVRQAPAGRGGGQAGGLVEPGPDLAHHLVQQVVLFTAQLCHLPIMSVLDT